METQATSLRVSKLLYLSKKRKKQKSALKWHTVSRVRQFYGFSCFKRPHFPLGYCQQDNDSLNVCIGVIIKIKGGLKMSVKNRQGVAESQLLTAVLKRAWAGSGGPLAKPGGGLKVSPPQSSSSCFPYLAFIASGSWLCFLWVMAMHLEVFWHQHSF